MPRLFSCSAQDVRAHVSEIAVGFKPAVKLGGVFHVASDPAHRHYENRSLQQISNQLDSSRPNAEFEGVILISSACWTENVLTKLVPLTFWSLFQTSL